MNKYFVYVMWALSFFLVVNQLPAMQRSFDRDMRERQRLISRAPNNKVKLEHIVGLLTLICEANPVPGSVVAHEVYYKSGMSSNYWDKNLFSFVREQFDQVMAAGGVDALTLATLKPLVDKLIEIFDPISEEVIYAEPTCEVDCSSSSQVVMASKKAVCSKPPAPKKEIKHVEHLEALLEAVDGVDSALGVGKGDEALVEGPSSSTELSADDVAVYFPVPDVSDRSATGFGRVQEVTTGIFKKNKSGTPMTDAMDEKAFDLALQWVGWMYARAAWDVSTSARLAAVTKPLSVPGLVKWAHGDTFTLSLKASAMEIFDQLVPFLDWLQMAMGEELTAARTAMMVVGDRIESERIRLATRKNTMGIMRAAFGKIHAVLPGIGVDE